MGLASPLLFGAVTRASLKTPMQGMNRSENWSSPACAAKRARHTDSTVPVDVMSAAEFANQGDTDLSNLLRNVVPSYNVNTQPISDAATIVRPANLRNLAPDHTLVLVNGKRRHRAAVIYWLGNGVADGAQGPDISPIPSIALKQVEVLRDGASAQYGSDAIAGVINFILNDANRARTSRRARRHYAGRRRHLRHQRQHRSAAHRQWLRQLQLRVRRERPDRPQRPARRRAALIAAGNTAVRDPAQIWGSPEIQDDVKTFVNSGSTSADSLELYGHGNYVSKTAIGGFYYRNPNTRAAVFSADDGETLLIGDLTPGDARRARRSRSPTMFPIRRRWRRCSPIRTASRTRRCSPADSRRSSAAT